MGDPRGPTSTTGREEKVVVMTCDLRGFQAETDDILVGQLVTRAFYTKTSDAPRSTPRLGRWSCAAQDNQQGCHGPWYPPVIHLHSNEACYCQTQRNSRGKATPAKLTSHQQKRNPKSIITPARTQDLLEIYYTKEGSPTPPDNTQLHHASCTPLELEPLPRVRHAILGTRPGGLASGSSSTRCEYSWALASCGGIGRGVVVCVGLCEVLVLVWDAVVSDELDDFVRMRMAWE